MPKKPHKKSTSKKHASKKHTLKKPTKKVTAKKKGTAKKGTKKLSPKKAPKRASKKAVTKAAAAGKANPFANLTEADLVQMKARAQADPSVAGMFSFLNTYLQASEYQVIQMMVNAKVWSGPVPLNPGGKGAAEFGTLDYDLNNPGSDKILQDLAWAWKFVVGSLPVTQINATNYANLQAAMAPGKPGLVASDGTWFSNSTYGTGDPGWTLAAAEYFYHYLNSSFAPFSVKSQPITLKGASPSQVRIALFGDWGTGNYTNGPAASVMKSIVAQSPDYIIHLGDVYYAGTPTEENNNLLALWPAAYSGKSLTLNSNHEMYDGAWGYFGVLANNIFSLQNQTSYFALQYGNPSQSGGPWTIIGLDSAYWSTSPFVMDGSIQEANGGPGSTAQPQFLQTLVKSGLSPRNTIVLTHHNPIDTFGASLVTDLLGNNLWAQVTATGALNGTPSAWYWGHVHNGIVYPNPTYTKNNVYGRCVGHGALPYGNGSGLASAPPTQVQAYSNTPNPKMRTWVMNGFVMLTITQSGQVTETFYEQDGTQALWVKPNPFTYRLG
jgi:hypothetical protein